MKRHISLFLSSGGLAFAVVFLGVMSVSAQEAAPRRAKLITQYDLPGLQKRISMDIKEAMNIEDFVKFLAIKGDLNVVIGRDVTGSTKLMLQDVTVGDALEIVLAANNLAYEVKGNIIKIMTDQEYQDTYGEKFYERRQAKIVELKYASPSRVAAMLGEVKSSIGKIVFDDTTGTIVLIDTPEKIQAMEAVIVREELPSVTRVLPTVTKVFTLEHATVEGVQAEVQSALTKDVGTIKADKRTRTLVVTDVPHAMEKIEHLIQVFDRRPKQVFIEAKVVQVTLTDQFRYGINWQYLFEGIDPRFTLQGFSQFPAQLTGGRYGSLSYATIGDAGELRLVLDALKTVGDTKILSNPHIAVLDGEEATIKVVKQQPYVELQFESGSTNVVGQSFQFVEVGISLNVTPKISQNGMISVAVNPEISDITEWYRGAPQEGTPVVQKANAQTSVMVKDGQTIIIGGLIRSDKIHTEYRVPLLGSIPLLGYLFKFKSDDLINSELVVFLTPRIITGEEPFSLSRDTEKTLKEIKGRP